MAAMRLAVETPHALTSQTPEASRPEFPRTGGVKQNVIITRCVSAVALGGFLNVVRRTARFRYASCAAIVAFLFVGVLSFMQLEKFARQEALQKSALYGYEVAPRAMGPGHRVAFIGWAGERPGEHYRPINVSEMPRHLQNAIIAIEDHRFLHHIGIDLIGVARAALANASQRRVTQGGSTITQQLVRLRLLTSDRTVVRKLKEVWLSLLVERAYSKPQIFEAYANSVYIGHRDGITIRGIGAAAEVYFGKSVRNLSLSESALLAGLLQAPNRYSPLVDTTHAALRRNVVLRRMHQLGMLNNADFAAAQSSTVSVAPYDPSPGRAPHFREYIAPDVHRLVWRLGRNAGRLRIQTTLDVSLQRLAEHAVQNGLRSLDRLGDRSGEQLEVALVALDVHTGDIRALVGGRDYRESRFNRAVSAHRQPGSTFKPFVYAAALSGERPIYQPPSLVLDMPISVTIGGARWEPRNFEGRYHGQVTVTAALVHSMNGATVRIAERVGYERIVSMARRLGITSPLFATPMIALGTFEVTPLELARAYVPFANDGVRPSPSPGAYVAEDPRRGALHAERVLSSFEAVQMTRILQIAARQSAAGAAVRPDCARDFAGKTGTTNAGRDAWFVGYSRSLVTVVWIGRDSGAPHGLSGLQAAAPIWFSFMCAVAGRSAR